MIASLFSGIGGLDAGLSAAISLPVRLCAEADPWRRDVLRRHYPSADVLPDVRDATRLLGLRGLTVLCGGFPCRGASTANAVGPRGMDHPQTGLWSVYADVIRLWRPPVVVIENVAALRTRGLDVVLRDLSGAGYDALWATLTASAVGAPHERRRLFIIARRRGVALRGLTLGPPPPVADWDAPIPENDHAAPDRRRRVAALGDAVVPLVAWHVGRTALRVLDGWWPESRAWTGEGLPSCGALVAGEVRELRADPWGVPAVSGSRWVTARDDGPPTEWVAPPRVGRLLEPLAPDVDPSDCVDVELPGGEVEPMPASWLRHGWPTPTRHDASERGSASTWERNSPPLSTLAQRCPWRGAVDGWQGWTLLDATSGQGDGPALVEWTQGFPGGWTA